MDKQGDLAGQLFGYSLAAGAVLAAGGAARADIVYSGPKDIWVHAGNTPVAVNLDDAGTVEFSVRYRYGRYTTTQTYYTSTYYSVSSIRTYWNRFYGQELKHFTGSAARLGINVKNLPSGATIGTGEDWAPTSMWLGMLWQWGSNFSVSTLRGNFPGNPGFIGIRFDDGGGDKYAWVAYECSLDVKQGHITGWAYDDSGAPIIAGDTGPLDVISEPSGLALLATGAAGVMGLRRKREE